MKAYQPHQPISAAKHTRMIYLWTNGHSAREIAQEIGVSMSTVYRWIKQWHRSRATKMAGGLAKMIWLLCCFALLAPDVALAQEIATTAESTGDAILEKTESSLHSPSSSDTVRRVSFQASEAATTDSYLRFLPEYPGMAAVTINLWIRFRHFSTGMDVFISYFGDKDDIIQYYHDWKNKEIVLRIHGYRLATPFNMQLYIWNHITISFDVLNYNYNVVINGQLMPSKMTVEYEDFAGESIPGGGILVIGQDQDSPGGDFAITQAISGDYADFCVLPRSFSLELIKDFKCSSHIRGNESIFTDALENWKVVGDVEILLINRTELSQATKDLFILLPEKKYFSGAFKLCLTLGLPMALPKDDDENSLLFEKSLVIESQCLSDWGTNLWIGAKGNPVTGKWENLVDGLPLAHDNLDEGFNYVSEARQCISMGSSLYPKTWYNTECSKYKPCPACENSPVNSIQVRGLCKESRFDRELHIRGTMNLKPVFHGNFYSKMWWDNNTWVMASRYLPDLKARMILTSPDDYPVGIHQWRISGDECPAEEVDLLLTVCGEESFPCNDGTCIHMSQRCDLRAHCDDGSDELGCDKAFIGSEYEKTLPPPPPETEDVLNVTLSVTITAIRKLNLLDQSVTLDVLVMSEWKDSRLNYADLQDEQYRNQIQNSERLWKPRIITTDEAGSLVDLVNRGSSLVVVRMSEPLPEDDVMVTKAIVFPGSGNPLLLIEELSITFQCQFDLLWFPFDNQRCSLNLKLNDVESKLVRMIASEPQYLGPEKLLEYQVQQVRMAAAVEGGSGQKLTVVFTNLFRYYLANSYLPSFLLVVISYSTFYFRLEDFNERIMVSITAMLVLVALFQQTSSTILKTTYLKLIDVWYMDQHGGTTAPENDRRNRTDSHGLDVGQRAVRAPHCPRNGCQRVHRVQVDPALGAGGQCQQQTSKGEVKSCRREDYEYATPCKSSSTACNTSRHLIPDPLRSPDVGFLLGL
ncbi:neurotransmitter gated ion channel [Penaeus vannamei]|uniref:Neurotransmitter gated ion channel n=1 Tax=Penaeus vannamei TaxID=6689 RepID=A0A423T124_PENVA|nr:neurotransmitter gated ion channel [Penaeus vannamei]